MHISCAGLRPGFQGEASPSGPICKREIGSGTSSGERSSRTEARGSARGIRCRRTRCPLRGTAALTERSNSKQSWLVRLGCGGRSTTKEQAQARDGSRTVRSARRKRTERERTAPRENRIRPRGTSRTLRADPFPGSLFASCGWEQGHARLRCEKKPRGSLPMATRALMVALGEPRWRGHDPSPYRSRPARRYAAIRRHAACPFPNAQGRTARAVPVPRPA